MPETIRVTLPDDLVKALDQQALAANTTRAVIIARALRLGPVVDDAIADLGIWLTDNTEKVFEEEPEIDDIRYRLHEARNP